MPSVLQTSGSGVWRFVAACNKEGLGNSVYVFTVWCHFLAELI